MPESGEMTEVLPPVLLKGRQQGRWCLHTTESQGILCFIKIGLKQNCSYSCTH